MRASQIQNGRPGPENRHATFDQKVPGGSSGLQDISAPPKDPEVEIIGSFGLVGLDLGSLGLDALLYPEPSTRISDGCRTRASAKESWSANACATAISSSVTFRGWS